MTEFEERLRAALIDASGARPATDSDWTALQARLAGGSGGDPAPAQRGPRPGWLGGWRGPVFAAVAVAALVTTVTVLATRGPSNAPNVATPGQDGTSADGLVFAHHTPSNGGDDALLEGTVNDLGGCLVVTPFPGASPVVPSFPIPGSDPASLRIGDRVSLAGGFTEQAPSDPDDVIPDPCRGAGEYFVAWQLTILGVDATAPPIVKRTAEIPPAAGWPVTVPVDTGLAGTARQEFEMRLSADLLLHVDAPGSDVALRADEYPDGTPLGYVRVDPSRAERPNALDTGGAYLYGIVGPGVDRIAVLATDVEGSGPDAGAPTDAYPSDGPVWVIASSGDPVPSEGRGLRWLWTDVADGWHAFAVQAPAPSPIMTVLVWDHDRGLRQARQFAANGTSYEDLPLTAAPDLDVWDPEPPEPRFGPEGPNGADGPLVATDPDIPGAASETALLEGRITVRDGCVVAESRDGTVTLVFPQSQVEPAEPPAVLNFRGEDYREGDSISVGGAMRADSAGVPGGCPAPAWGVSPY